MQVNKCVTKILTAPTKMGEIKIVVLLTSAKGCKGIGKGRAMSPRVLEANVSFSPRPLYTRANH